MMGGMGGGMRSSVATGADVARLQGGRDGRGAGVGVVLKDGSPSNASTKSVHAFRSGGSLRKSSPPLLGRRHSVRVVLEGPANVGVLSGELSLQAAAFQRNWSVAVAEPRQLRLPSNLCMAHVRIAVASAARPRRLQLLVNPPSNLSGVTLPPISLFASRLGVAFCAGALGWRLEVLATSYAHVREIEPSWRAPPDLPSRISYHSCRTLRTASA